MKLLESKKAVGDITDPMFWMIVGGIWIVALIAVWKLTWAGETDVTKIKIAFSIFSLPLIAGVCYLMGQNG